MFVDILDRFRIQFDERFGLEFFSCVAKSCLRDNVAGNHGPRKYFPKFVKFGLVGAFDQVAKIQDQYGERPFSVVGEVQCLAAVSFDEILIKNY
ncbi:MAG: hypothetical protein AB7U29_11865 [Desulfobulbus sp.]